MNFVSKEQKPRPNHVQGAFAVEKDGDSICVSPAAKGKLI